MGAKIWIDQLKFSDNSEISISKDEIVVFVGPNNAGKSASLKEMVRMLTNKNNIGKVVKDTHIIKEGSEAEMLNLISDNSMRTYDNSKQTIFRGLGYDIHESNSKHFWTNYATGLGELLPLFVNILSTEKRLNSADPPSNIKLTSEKIQHPIHYLQLRDDLESRFSNYFRQAFGTELMVHRNAGSEVPLYVGEKPTLREGMDRISVEYLRELEKKDLLQEQGDGMRSFVGVLLNAFISDYSMIFIDEPEAFLHPPQARLLGKMLAKDLPSSRQLFLATHSEDFLKGLLDANINNLKVIRIQRENNINRASLLTSADIEQIWRDPLLRHSNILSGLFHSKVVVCEGDSDCRFYSAILSSQYDESGQIAPDILFIHCGGKHRIPVAVNSLKKLNVPLKIILDFDALNDVNPLKTIFESLGGNWSEVESDWRLVKNEIEKKRPELLTEDVKIEIGKVFDQTNDRIFPDEKISEIKTILKKATAWFEAKMIGKPYIPSGNATQAFDRIQSKFKEKGVIVLDVGQVEGFVRSIGNHGPKWVNDVLVRNLKTDPELEIARQFVAQLIM